MTHVYSARDLYVDDLTSIAPRIRLVDTDKETAIQFRLTSTAAHILSVALAPVDDITRLLDQEAEREEELDDEDVEAFVASLEAV